MTIISAGPETLMRQAAMTAHTYYLTAVRDLPDDVAPEIIAAYMQAASQDMAGSIIAKILEEKLSTISESLDELARAIHELAP